MLGYLRHLYRNIFKKAGVYISAFVVYLLFSLTTYLLPFIWGELYHSMVLNLTCFVINILGIAIFATITTVYIFKDGVEDGTELLIASKPISRIQNIWAKVACLISLIFIFGVPLLFVMAFLRLAYSYAWAFILGTYIMFILVSSIFAGITIICSLIFKKIGSTLSSIGAAMFVIFITMLNSLLTTSPSIEMTTSGYQVRYLTLESNVNDQEVKSFILTKNGLPLKGENDDTNLLINEYNKAVQKSKIKYTYIYDFGMQWLSLLTLDNYFNINRDNYFDNVYPFTPKLCEFTSSDKSNLRSINLDGTKYYINKQYNINVMKYKTSEIKNNFYKQINSQYIIIPIFNVSGNQIDSTNPISLHVFKKDQLNNLYDKVYELVFNDTSKSINQHYSLFLSSLKNQPVIRFMLNYDNAFLNFFTSYYVTGLDSLLSSIAASDNAKTFNINYYDENNIQTVQLSKTDLMKNSKISKLVNTKNNMINNEQYNISIANPSYLCDLQSIMIDTLSQIQNVVIDNIEDAQGSYSPEVKKVIKQFLHNETNNIMQNPLSYEEIPEFTKLMNNPQSINELNSFVEIRQIKNKNIPYNIYDNLSLSSLSNAKIYPIMNFWGIIFGWGTFTALLWYIGAFIYCKKDFR